MGDPRRFGKKFARPFRLWDETRIAEEKDLLKAYGLKNKNEIWRTETMLRRFKGQAKNLIAMKGPQAEKEKQQLIARLISLGLTSQTADLDTVLGLTINNLLDRRLQTLVFNKKLARTIAQARQFIVHEQITVKGRKTAVPSYLVKRDEEDAITFAPESPLASETHPERVIKQPGTPTDTEAAQEAKEIVAKEETEAIAQKAGK
ncbi:30S ribosomal protein S4 [Candidatus Woesearchaeota archaeon]|nr:30S ribosomal protein S4 [Candidatus Woesearchaeota archaeon]